MGPTNDLAYLLQHLAAVLGRQTDQVLQEQLGIGLSQFRILMVLEWNPRLSQKAIAENLGQTEASISRQVRLLQSKGLLVSKRDPNDHRTHLTAPTAMGLQITEAAAGILRRSMGPDFAQLGEDQLLNLITGLKRLHLVVCAPGKRGACEHAIGL